MISQETYELLRWIKANAGEGLHPYQMEELGAPFATDSSIEELRRRGYLRSVYDGYVVSIDGASALWEYEHEARREQVELRRFVITTAISAAALVASIAATVVGVLNLVL